MLLDDFYVNFPSFYSHVQHAPFLRILMKIFISRFSQVFTHFICFFSSIFIPLLLWIVVKGKYYVLYDIIMVIIFVKKNHYGNQILAKTLYDIKSKIELNMHMFYSSVFLVIQTTLLSDQSNLSLKISHWK
jgi:hypothetical protein